ncbi:MAG: hypothetical protein KDA84_09565, partial [Planctomycetaceae bacterium]|nr:hypothetical protein [Planctomycetaceae bacterium]
VRVWPNEFTAPRLKPQNAEQLQRFVGTYSSEELDATYRISIADGSPVVSVGGFDFKVSAIYDKTLVGSGLKLTFQSDEEQRPGFLGFQLDMERATGITFTRKEPS